MNIRSMVSAVAVAATLVLQAAGARAQQAQPQPMTDQEFVREAATGGVAEVELGRLASQRAMSDVVRQFAERMVTDHGQANAELAQLAQQKGWSLPQSPDPGHQALRDRLAGMSGAQFDRAYMEEMVRDHNHDVAAFEQHARSGNDPELRAWAAKRLPTLRQHRAMAQSAHSQVAGLSGAAGAASPATAVAVTTAPWCGGAYAPSAGTNFGNCPGHRP